MKIAVTATSGYLGSAIVKALLQFNAKENIVALARTQEKAKHLGMEVRGDDYNDFEELKISLQCIDTILLVSGMDKPKNRIGQHRNVINAAKEVGVKKIVYTSIQGADEGNNFSPIVQSNRQTEADVRNSGLDWAIGRNGIYIEPDVEYIENYKKMGVIKNCANDGLCGYTSRPELGYAYAKMLTEDKHNGQIYNLHGTAITQYQLADYINFTFGTNLTYQPMTVGDFTQFETQELGEFLGKIIAGIYQGIAQGKVNNPSDFEKATGRPHQSWEDYFAELKFSIQ